MKLRRGLYDESLCPDCGFPTHILYKLRDWKIGVCAQCIADELLVRGDIEEFKWSKKK